jgi:hypothetical protein
MVMASIINNKYGPTIDASKYLNKFVEKKYLFSNTKHFELWFKNEINNGKEKFNSPLAESLMQEFHTPILKMKKNFGLNLRDIEQIIITLKSYRNITSIFAFTYTLAIEFLKCINKQEYSNIVAHYHEKHTFAVNAPELFTFKKIFQQLAGEIDRKINMSSANAFYYYARNNLCQ